MGYCRACNNRAAFQCANDLCGACCRGDVLVTQEGCNYHGVPRCQNCGLAGDDDCANDSCSDCCHRLACMVHRTACVSSSCSMKRNQSCANDMCGVCCPEEGEDGCDVHSCVGQRVLRVRQALARAEAEARAREAQRIAEEQMREQERRAEELRQRAAAEREAARRKAAAEASRREAEKMRTNTKAERRVNELQMLLAKWDSEDGGHCKQKHWPECMMCMDAHVNTAFLPCAHLISCFPCAKRTVESKWECPKCRARVTSVQKMYVDL